MYTQLESLFFMFGIFKKFNSHKRKTIFFNSKFIKKKYFGTCHTKK